MKASCFHFFFILVHVCVFQLAHGRNVTGTRPSVLNIGAILSFNSTIGRVAKIAIDEAVKDVNADPNILPGTHLVVTMQNSNCSGFLGMIQAMQLMEKDVVAIIGPQCSVVSHIVSHVATELQVPLLSFGATDPSLSSIQFPFFVRSTQSDSYQMAAVAHIIDYYSWKEVIAIFIDDDYGRNGLAELSDNLAENRCRISYKAGIQPLSVASRSEVMDILVKVALMESRVIVLHVNPVIGKDIFAVAKYLGMMGNGYVWIATDWLASYLDSAFPLPSEFMDNIQGIIVLRQHTPDSDKKRAFFARWNMKTGGSPGLNSYGLYAYDSVWLFAHAINSFFDQGGVISFSNDSKIPVAAGSLHLEDMNIFDNGHLLLKSILGTNFVGLTGPVRFDSDRSLVFPAYDVVNVIGTGMRRIGYWSNYSGLSTVPPETLYSKPPNRSSSSQQLYSVIWPGETSSKPRGWVFSSNGKQLRVGVPNRVSFKEFVSKVQGTENFQGFCIDVFSAAINLLPYGVPYKFIAYGDGKKNPNYSDLVNKITTGDFDAVVGDIAIVKNRTKMVDFTQPYAASGLVVVAPFHKSNIGAWAFLQPFSRQMWMVTAASFLVVGAVVWILEHRLNDEFRGSPRQQAVTVLWFSFSTLFFSHRETTVSSLGRFVLIIWLFVVLIINSSYTASLTSILTVQKLSSPIKGIETLRQSNVPIGYQVGSFAERYLSEELNISKSRLVPLGSPEEYAKALKLGPDKEGGVAAVVDELPYVEIFLSRQCTFRIVGQQFSKSSWGFAFPRDSPLADDVSTAILALAENGDLQRIHDKWLMRSGCTSEENELESDRLELKSFWGLFLICGIVCFLALFLYFLHLLRRLRRHGMAEAASPSAESRLGSSSIHRLLSLMDERKQKSVSGSKRRKAENSESDTIDGDAEVGRSKRRTMDYVSNCS